MKFYAISDITDVCVLTDDYNDREIARKQHLQDLRQDARQFPKFKYPIRVYDQNDKFICVLND